MKSPFLRSAGYIALLAVSGYVAFSALPLFCARPETAAVHPATVRETLPVYGVFLREELVLPASDTFVEAMEGQRVAAGTLAGESGIFTAYLDGFEHLDAPPLTVEAIRDLCLDRRVALASPGKLITGSRFSFYALLESSRANRLKIGQACSLETDYWGGVYLSLQETGEVFGEFTPARFTGSGNMDAVRYLRQVSGRLHLGSYTGLKVPDSAIFEDKEGLYVQVLTLGEAQRAPITIVYDGDGFKLISSPLLYEGSEVIIRSGGN